MTKEEIRKFLGNTKVYVNGKSKEIQEKLFSFGYKWNRKNPTEVCFVDMPFLLLCKDWEISYTNNMLSFFNDDNREISAEEILSLEITEPSYRPFKDKDECWNEMQKHQPFGWLRAKHDDYYTLMKAHISEITLFKQIFNAFDFADGTPFGIKDN